MKKLISIILICAICVSAAACTKKENNSSSNSSDTQSSVSSLPSFSQASKLESYTYEEAAKLNAEITPADVQPYMSADGAVNSDSDKFITGTIKTSAGEIPFVLYPQEAPLAVENFVKHSQEGYFNGMSFYKAVENFMIQTGAPGDKESESIFKDDEGNTLKFESEYSLNLWNFRGALTMVNKGADRPDTNQSEFMIIQAPFVDAETLAVMQQLNYPEKVIEIYKKVGGVPGFDWHNTVFGYITGEGLDIVDEIAKTEVSTVIIENIVIDDYSHIFESQNTDDSSAAESK